MQRSPYIYVRYVPQLAQSYIYTSVAPPSPSTKLYSQPPERTMRRCGSVEPIHFSNSPNPKQRKDFSRCKTEFIEQPNLNTIYKVEYENGNTYFGQIENKKRQGNGALYDKECQLIYMGQWNNDLYDGVGILVTNDRKYTGQFSHGKQFGQVVEENKDYKFYGFFKDGQRDGPGTLYTKNETIQGIWRNGKML